MADLTFPRGPIRGTPKSPYGIGSESPVMRKSPSRWANRGTDDGETTVVMTPMSGKVEHTQKVTETIEDKTVVAIGDKKGQQKTGGDSYGYGMYAIGFIVLFIIIFLIVLAAFYFARPECVTRESCDSGNDDRELDFWRAGIYAFIIAIIFVIIIAALVYSCSRC